MSQFDDMGSEPSLSDTEQLEISEDFIQDSPHIDIEDEQYDERITWGSHVDPWVGMDLLERWKDVMKKLLNNEIRWDEDDILDNSGGGRKDEWNPKPAILDPQKKKSLAEADQKYRPDPTILHRLALDLDHEGFSNLMKKRTTTAHRIVNYLLEQHIADPQHTADENPILKRAIESKNFEFIKLLLKPCKGFLPDLLDSKEIRGANCLHYLFRHHLPLAAKEHARTQWLRKAGKDIKEMPLNLSETVYILGTFALHAKPSTVIARDELGNTPIHYAMQYINCRLTLAKYPAIVITLAKKADRVQVGVEQFLNDAKESPYLYFDRTRKEYLDGRRKEFEQRKSSPPPTTVGTRPATGGNSKTAKREILDSRAAVAAPEQVERDVDIYSKGPSARDFHRRPDPREGFAKRKPDMAPPASSPSVGAREDFKGHNVAKARVSGNVDAPPGYGLSSTRTGETFKAPTNPKGPTHHYTKSATLNPLEPGVASLNEKMLGTSEAGGPTTESRPDTYANEDKEVARTEAPWEEPPPQHEAAENVRRELKLHYIRTQSDRKAKVLLYGRVASDKNLYLDATHLEGRAPKDVVKLVAMLAHPGGLEDTLSFVKLPVLSYTSDTLADSSSNANIYDANEGRQRDSGENKEKGTGRNSVVAVFDELAKAKVIRILRLVVEEDVKSPHSDGAIERAIHGMDSSFPQAQSKRENGRIAIEIWDWKKFDLSIDVITYAAPEVTEVNLYWSGNQTILRGWASEEGIPRLYNKSHKEGNTYRLKTVNVHWKPGFEGYDRCDRFLDNFSKVVQQRIRKIRGKAENIGFNIKILPLKGSITGTSAAESYSMSLTAAGMSSRAPPAHGWIEAMENFRLVLMKMHAKMPKEPKPERAKIALIDDGIDHTQLQDYGNRVEVTGMSYWSSTSTGVTHNPSWHQSTRGHGTIMANSITRVNPWVSLYIMRIQDEVDFGPRNEISLRIHAASAASAIEDAIILDVSIISISWTIHNIAEKDESLHRDTEVKELRALKEAIAKAKTAGILFFCSASDDIQKRGLEMLPYSEVPKYAFRIGAADAFGWSDRATEDHNAIDWFFPGNQVADDRNPRSVRTSELEYRDGSSVATALAAGLASLILYLTNVMKAHYRDDDSNAARYGKIKKELQNREGLKRAFGNIVTKDENYMDKKFLPVWTLFGEKAKLIESRRQDDWMTKWGDLAELCNSLYSGVL